MLDIYKNEKHGNHALLIQIIWDRYGHVTLLGEKLFFSKSITKQNRIKNTFKAVVQW